MKNRKGCLTNKLKKKCEGNVKSEGENYVNYCVKEYLKQNEKIYENPLYYPYPDAHCTFNVGCHVYAIQEGNTFYSEAIITSISNGVYTIQFNNGVIQIVTNVTDLKIYFPCNCDNTLNVISTGEGCSFPINSVNSIVGIGPAL
jgi:hypothetical protein